MEFEEFKLQVSQLMSEIELQSPQEITQLASYLAACSSSVVSQIDEVYNETSPMPKDEEWQENAASLDTLVFALGIDVVDLPEDRLRAAMIALQKRITRKSLLGTVDQVQVLDCFLGLLVGYVSSVIIASRSDDVLNVERWKSVGNMLRKDILDRITVEIRKHNPDVGELN